MGTENRGGRPLMLKEVKKKRAYEDVVKQIRNLIYLGRLRRGDKLPSEQELMNTFEVCRGTVREAILSLETMKLVDRSQGNGTFVIASSEEALVQSLAASFFHEKDKLIDIFSLRKIVEPEIAQLGSQNRTYKEVVELARILKEQEKEVFNGENQIQIDTRFHHLLARMAKNMVLERLLLALFDKTRETHLQSKERKLRSLQCHRDILAAIKRGNGRAARQALRRHLEDIEGILFNEKRGGGKRF